MEDKVRNLRKRYESFEKGNEDALTVRNEAKRIGDGEILEEVGDMLIELEFSMEDNMCKCHRKSPNC